MASIFSAIDATAANLAASAFSEVPNDLKTTITESWFWGIVSSVNSCYFTFGFAILGT